MSDEPSRWAFSVGSLGALACIAVLAAGIGSLSAIPVWFPDDSDELAPTLTLLVVLTLTTWTIAGGLLLARGRRARDLANGLLVGYVLWFLYFMLWFVQGP
jgi:hypothetical protein